MSKREFITAFVLARAAAAGVRTDGEHWSNEALEAWKVIKSNSPVYD